MNSMYTTSVDSPKFSMVLMLVFGLAGLVLAFVKVDSVALGSAGWPVTITSITLAWAVLFMFAVHSYYRTLYLLSGAYILALALFHLGLIYQLAFGLVDIPSWTGGRMSSWMEKTGWYVFMAFCSFGCGIALAAITGRPSTIAPELREATGFFTDKFLMNQALGLGLACIVFMVMAINAYGNILAYSRAELFNLNVDTRGFGVLLMVLPGAVTLFFLSARSFNQKLIAYILAALVFSAILLSGYRSAALFPALVCAVLWVKSGRKIPLPIAVGAFAFVLLAISIVGIFRQLGSYESLGMEQLGASYEEANLVDSISEMGGSAGVFGHVLRLVPDTDSFTYGHSYWLAFKNMFPNVTDSINAEESRSSMQGQAKLNQSQLVKMAPADWITYRLNRWKFENGQGVGFSAIAEPYLNFGTFGVIAFFVILGYILGRLDMVDLVGHPYCYLLLATAFWPLIRTVRNDFSNFTKPFGFILLILLIWNIAMALIGRRVKPFGP